MKANTPRSAIVLKVARSGFGFLASASLLLSGISQAATVTWFAPTDASNSNATFAVSTSYTSNYGVAFTTGSLGAYSIDWANIGLNTSSLSGGASVSLRIALRNTTNSTVYSAVAGTTEYAMDALTFTLAPTNTNFTLSLTPADIPNICAYEMAGNTSYALILYYASAAFGIQRHTGYAQNTTNNYYSVSEGFTALDTFRNNISNYTNSVTSYPTLAIAFGATTVPEPASAIFGGIGLIVCFLRRRR